MKKLLVLNATTNKETSRTYFIYQHIINNLNLEGYKIKQLDLYQMDIPFLNYEMVNAKDNKIYISEIDKEIEKIALEFCTADAYIFICPTWNLSVPAVFKAYIDLICDKNKVFAYVKGKRIGLLKGKKVILINTAGGPMTYGIDYMVNISEFMGLEHQEYFIPRINKNYKNKPYELLLENIKVDPHFFKKIAKK